MIAPYIFAQIEFLKDCIRKGYTTLETRKKFFEKWPDCPHSSFIVRNTRANKQIREEQKAISKQAEQLVYHEIRSKAIRILSLVERKEILTQIALGQLTITKPINVAGKVEYVQCEPDYTDRRLAIAELNKIDGSYQPIRADITTNGQSLTPVTTTVIQFNGVDVPLLQ